MTNNCWEFQKLQIRNKKNRLIIWENKYRLSFSKPFHSVVEANRYRLFKYIRMRECLNRPKCQWIFHELDCRLLKIFNQYPWEHSIIRKAVNISRLKKQHKGDGWGKLSAKIAERNRKKLEMTERISVKQMIKSFTKFLTLKKFSNHIKRITQTSSLIHWISKWFKEEFDYVYKRGNSRSTLSNDPEIKYMQCIFWHRMTSLISDNKILFNADEAKYSRSVKHNYAWFPKGKNNSIINLNSPGKR